jgi:hypothetical protein
MTTDTDTTAAIRAAAAEITAAIRRLSELARADGEMGDMVAVLDAFEAAGGPLDALGDLLTDGAGWLADFEDEDADTAADRMENTSGQVGSVREGLDLALRFIRPLAG